VKGWKGWSDPELKPLREEIDQNQRPLKEKETLKGKKDFIAEMEKRQTSPSAVSEGKSKFGIS